MSDNIEKVINREVSWLAFNERVLQEAADTSVPLIERLKFLGIFSNNLDEFFRVRFAAIQRVVQLGIKTNEILGGSPEEILDKIRDITALQRSKFAPIYESILEQLEQRGLYMINEKQLDANHSEFVKNYFDEKVRPVITPIMIDSLYKLPTLTDKHIYLAVKLSSPDNNKIRYALIEVPTDVRSRFVVLPEKDGKKYVMMLDDVIRANLKDIFYIFSQTHHEAYTLKITKNAELDIDNDVSQSFVDLVSQSLKKRKKANTVRFIYDRKMPKDLLDFLISKQKISDSDSVVMGGRYHNFKDFIDFPRMGLAHLRYKPVPPIRHRDLAPYSRVIPVIRQQDVMLHFPYNSFHHIIDLLHEAAIDPKVKSISITLYRIANDSVVGNALLNALRNGKEVTVVVELQARFDEENNIYWADKLKEEGANIIYGVKTLKVHCKLLLITRKEKGRLVNYANISTGNFNESTARIYTDQSLLTSDKRLTKEVAKLFEFFKNNLNMSRYRYLMVSPFNLRKKLINYINREIRNAGLGKEAYILLKVNGLIDYKMIKKLYQAGKAGVKIRLIVRGVCSLLPSVPGLSENIEVISIVDKYLEHSRMFIFGNSGSPEIFIGSADWMTRNLDHRVEVCCPVFDEKLREELINLFEIQWRDNVKARINDGPEGNAYRVRTNGKKHRSQVEIHKYLKTLNSEKGKEEIPLSSKG